MYSNQELFLKSNADTVITDEVDEVTVNSIFEETQVLFDASTYVLKLPSLDSPQSSGDILKSLYTSITNESNIIDENYTHFNATSLLMLLVAETSYLAKRVADLEGHTSSIDSSTTSKPEALQIL